MLESAAGAWYDLLLSLPILLDVGLVTWLGHGKPQVATQMLGMNLLSHGVAGLAAYSITTLVARERPFTEPCRSDPDYDVACGDVGSENASFFSGHAAAAFAGAGATCAHHAYLPLYGGGAPDTAACLTAVVMASAVALLRVSTDNHYLTDVLVGSGLGFGVGYGLPYLLHYRHGRAAPAFSVMPRIDRDHVGVAVVF